MTIDVNELRRKLRSDDLIDHIDIHANVKPTLAELMDRLEAAENENAKLRTALAEKVTSETTLRDLSVGNGSINATFEGGAIQLMVDALATQFVESGASNYIEMQFHSEATGPLLFTLQRVDGKTPHQLRAEAEQERDWHAERCQDAMTECDALRAENEALAANLRGKHSTAGATYAHLIAERDALRAAVRHEADCVDAAKAEIEALRAENASLVEDMNLLRNNNVALRAKIAEMEKQEPVD